MSHWRWTLVAVCDCKMRAGVARLLPATSVPCAMSWPRRYFTAAPEEFADLQPGMLSAELRAALGDLGSADPPPWLHRMRALGYPPGYMCAQRPSECFVTILGLSRLHRVSLQQADTSAFSTSCSRRATRQHYSCVDCSLQNLCEMGGNSKPGVSLQGT